MFSKATASVIRQVENEESLINVSRLNDSDKLGIMTLVVKPSRWFWQSPKYQPTDFTLSDLLLGDEDLRPEVSETDFLTIKGVSQQQISGGLEVEVSLANVGLEGSNSSNLVTCFGLLKKQKLDVRKLCHDSSERLVDVKHVLVQQTKKKKGVLAVVTERVFTTSPCSIIQTKDKKCIFSGALNVQRLLGSPGKMSGGTASSSIEVDSVVYLEIPANRVIAYSILELEISDDGNCTICLLSGMQGGFVSRVTIASRVDICVESSRDDDEAQEFDLHPLAELPESTRRVFIEKLQETMMDRPALTSLQFVLEELCNGETLSAEDGNISEEQEKLVAAILDQPGQKTHSGNDISAQLKAAHLLVSAIEELPDETLNLLSRSSHEDLQAFDMLVSSDLKSWRSTLTGPGKPLSVHTLPVLLQDSQRLQLATQLLSSAKVTLRRDDDYLWTESEENAGFLPLVLYLSIHGLAVLCSGLK